MAAEHRAVEIGEFNSTDPCAACRLSTRKTPSPGRGQVLVRVLCRSINPSDILAIQGHYKSGWHPKTFPAVPGFEGMGVVEKLGENVSNVTVGQRVFALSPRSDLTGQGLWQEYIVAPAMLQIPMPDSISDEIAAQFLVNPWSVYGMFHVLNVPEGEYILQTAAASVLGRMFIQYCHYRGVKTINLVRRNEQKEELKALGADEVINVAEEDVFEQVTKITDGKLAYAAIDCVGGDTTKTMVQCVRDSSTVLIYGLLGAFHLEANIQDILFRDVKLHGFFLATWLNQQTPHAMGQITTHITTLIENKVISPLVGEKFHLHQIKEAIKKTLEPGRHGKVLLVSE